MAAGDEPLPARRGRRGGRSQHFQLVRVNHVEHLYLAPSSGRSRSRGRSRGSGGAMAPMIADAGAPQPKARPFNVWDPPPAPLVAVEGAPAPSTPPWWPPPPPPPARPPPLPPQPQELVMAPAAASATPWPARVMAIFQTVGVSEYDYDPLTIKLDGWARASKKDVCELCMPLPDEVDGPLNLFVGFHGTNEGGLLGILNDGRLKPGPASWENNHLYAMGFLADNARTEQAQSHNKWFVENILKHMGAKSGKHACGVVVEVATWGIHKSCKNVEQEGQWAGRRHIVTHFRDHLGSRWAPPSEKALVRALWVDLNWPWESSDCWLF